LKPGAWPQSCKIYAKLLPSQKVLLKQLPFRLKTSHLVSRPQCLRRQWLRRRWPASYPRLLRPKAGSGEGGWGPLYKMPPLRPRSQAKTPTLRSTLRRLILKLLRGRRRCFGHRRCSKFRRPNLHNAKGVGLALEIGSLLSCRSMNTVLSGRRLQISWMLQVNAASAETHLANVSGARAITVGLVPVLCAGAVRKAWKAREYSGKGCAWYASPRTSERKVSNLRRKMQQLSASLQ